jgi:hypothetical protein
MSFLSRSTEESGFSRKTDKKEENWQITTQLKKEN